MKTVHVVFNSHIDPIWLWPWQSGLDEVLATCRSACDRLDAHPDLTFTRGEAWVYDQVERVDPALFARIRAHAQAGRWEVVGGWWIQPDCNLPSAFALERQIGLGRDYFQSRFGAFPRTAYNVDSFGHAATLPGLMQKFGQDRYVMMRPQPSEMAPAERVAPCLFRWRGFEGGPEVTVFRIVKQYNIGRDLSESKIRAALEPLPDGVDETMLFVGFGDHGGGPSEKQIAWLREHQHAFDGICLEFSSVSRFFDAVEEKRGLLAVVTGELQQHAIGCYSVYRPIKTAVRKAEHLVRQAELFLDAEPESCPPDAPAQLTEAWKRICFHHFHDTLGGSCLPSAYAYPLAQMGYAQDVAETLLQEGLRRRLNALPDDPLQRIVLYNASDTAYDGPAEFMPWLDGQEWDPDWRLIDEDGAAVPHQIIAPEALIGTMVTLLFPITVAPRSLRVLRIAPVGGPTKPDAPAVAGAETLSVSDRVSVSLSSLAFASGLTLATPALMLYDDPSDTWSHELDRYAEEPVASARWENRALVDRGPLMVSWIRRGTIGSSRVEAEWRVYSGSGVVELRLSVHWQERHKLLKLVQPLPASLSSGSLSSAPPRRIDGIPGGWLTRPLDGRELPLQGGVIIEGKSASETFGIVAPDVYALDATAERLRFTLLRSSLMAHHAPYAGPAPRPVFSDQGEHSFVFRYLAGPSVSPASMDAQATQLQRPLLIADLTRGMPHRLYEQWEIGLSA